MIDTLNRFWNTDESGQGLVEYSLLVALVALGVITSVILFRDGITSIFNGVTAQLGS